MDPFSVAVVSALSLMRGRVQYRPTHKDRLAEHPIRRTILDISANEPGLTMTAMRRRLGCAWGTLHHHMRMLEDAGMIHTAALGRRRRIFPGDMPEQELEKKSIMARGRMWDLARWVIARPGAVQMEITSELALTRKTLRTYVDNMVAAGLIDEVVEGRYRAYYPREELIDLALEQGRGADTGPHELDGPGLDSNG